MRNQPFNGNRFIPSHPYVRQLCYMFTRALCDLPTSGDEYSGLHPAWCFLIACACTNDSAEYERMYDILEYIGGVNKSVRTFITTEDTYTDIIECFEFDLACQLDMGMEKRSYFECRMVGGNDGTFRLADGRELDLCYIARF